jgi:hypothetical protein
MELEHAGKSYLTGGVPELKVVACSCDKEKLGARSVDRTLIVEALVELRCRLEVHRTQARRDIRSAACACYNRDTRIRTASGRYYGKVSGQVMVPYAAIVRLTRRIS